MILNNIEVKILASIELEDAYNKKFPKKFIGKNVIYCIHNKINSKNYIGQTSRFRGRFSNNLKGHFRCYKDFIEGNLKYESCLYKAWKKYGLNSFIIYIIEENCLDREELNDKECYWIKTLHTCTKDPNCNGYNITWGGNDISIGMVSSKTMAKARQTKLEKYGTIFVNTNTPEAIEKRKQTLLDRYGTTSTVINRDNKKLSHDTKITKFFNRVEKILSGIQGIITLESYFNEALRQYKEVKKARHRHFEKLTEQFDDLRSDKRWSPTLELIFGDSPEILQQKLDILYERRYNSNLDKQRTEEWRMSTKAWTNLGSINRIANIDSDMTWETFKSLIFKKYNYSRAIKRINDIIDIIPYMKKLSNWTKDHEKIFGSLTDNDKEILKNGNDT